jgi:hypothetical protein
VADEQAQQTRWSLVLYVVKDAAERLAMFAVWLLMCAIAAAIIALVYALVGAKPNFPE